jgi:Protein ChrB, N-terminal
VPELEWVLLAYRIPREPSTPRIAVWRKLRRLGAVQLVDGCVALPADPATIEAFDWLADQVIEAGGEAWTWRARPGSKLQQQALRGRLTETAAEEYRSLTAEALDPATDPSRRTVGRLRRELRLIEARDPFRVPEREEARDAVGRLAAQVDAREAEAAR